MRLEHLPAMLTFHFGRLACEGQPVVARSVWAGLPMMGVMNRILPVLAAGGERTVAARAGALQWEPFRFGQPILHSVRITNRWSGPGQRALLGR